MKYLGVEGKYRAYFLLHTVVTHSKDVQCGPNQNCGAVQNQTLILIPMDTAPMVVPCIRWSPAADLADHRRPLQHKVRELGNLLYL